VPRKKRPLSEKDKRLFAAAIIVIPGRIFFILGIAMSAVYVWLGIPGTSSPLRLTVGTTVGAVLILTGYRLASGNWKGSLQPLVYSYGAAGFLFLVYLLKLNLLAAHRTFPPVWLFLLMEAPLLWLLLTKRRPQPARQKKPAFP
jgi:hypothetical protein